MKDDSVEPMQRLWHQWTGIQPKSWTFLRWSVVTTLRDGLYAQDIRLVVICHAISLLNRIEIRFRSLTAKPVVRCNVDDSPLKQRRGHPLRTHTTFVNPVDGQSGTASDGFSNLAVRDSEATYSGQLVIGMAPSIGRACIPMLLPKLTQLYPRASISVLEGLSGALYEGVRLGQMYIALLYNPVASPNIKITPIVSEPLYLISANPVGPDQDRVTLAALATLR